MNRAAEPYRKVMEVVNAFESARILHAGVALDVFTRVADEGKTAAQLASVLHLDARALELLLNALVGMGFLHKEAERFHDTPISHTFLARGGPKYLGHFIRAQARSWNNWEKLEEVLRTGKPVRPPAAVESDGPELEDLVRGMHELALARGDARYMARAIPLTRCQKLIDVGGGPGTCAALFCRANPRLRAVVMDLPPILNITRRILKDFDITAQVATLPGDYRRDPIPGGPYDVALLYEIVHREDEETNRLLLRKVYEALAPGGILIASDYVLNEARTQPEHGAVLALAMLLGTRGRTYSFAEMSGWMQAAGFQDMVQLPLEMPMSTSILLALRPGKRALAVLPRPAARLAVESKPAAELSERSAPLPGPAPTAELRSHQPAAAHPDPRRAPRPPVAAKGRPSHAPATKPRSPGTRARKHTKTR